MKDAIRTVLVDCLAVRAGENVVVVTDPARRPIAEDLIDGARELGADAVLAEMAERETHGTEPAVPIAAAMRAADVVIAPTTWSVSHTEARRAANEAGARVATMPQITQDMLERCMTADYGSVRRLSRAVADALTAAEEVHVATDAGTDLTFSVAGRSAIADDGDLSAPGAFGNLPAGEGFLAPVEGTSRGRLVVDATMSLLGRMTEPIVFDISDGYITGIEGERAEEWRAKVEPHGKEAFAVAEFGVGTNEKAIVTGNVLEDEKIIGTIHVAFGDNHTFGGTVRVSSHHDGILTGATVTLDGRVELMVKGALRL